VIDLHTHILPGLDDGAGDMAQAVAMCRLAANDGTTTMVATPHMFDGVYNVDREQILHGVQRLAEALAQEGIKLQLLPGADVYAHAGLVDLLRSGKAMTVADGDKYLMVELSRDVLPPQTEEMLFSVQLMGITPILTHPERHPEIQKSISVLARLVRTGNLVQVTAASLTGRFGRRAEKCGWALMEKRLAHLVASDAHSLESRPPGLSQARREVQRLLGHEEAERIFEEFPRSIVAGKPVHPPERAERVRPPRRRRWAWRRW